MLPETEQEIFRHRTPAKRFSADEARRILDRAAEVQSRRDRELDGSYSAEELEEIASEAGIAPDALRAAILSSEERIGLRRRTGSRLRLPVSTPPVLLGIAGIALLILLVAIPEFAYAFAFITVLLLLAVVIAA